ncbi:MAG TPA: O-antigen ligase family protein [Candidatus Andersenbacteria bacterium]|nr:O-antigen ligase family protein [Candidatus Andersenbacteria bacterium]
MNRQANKSLYTNLLLITAGMLPLYIIRFSLIGIPTNLLEICILFLLILGLCSGSVRNSWITTLYAFPKNSLIAVCIFLLSACIATLISQELRTSLGILKSWIVVPAIFGFFVASASQTGSIIKNRILDSLICSGTVFAALGILQIGTLARIKSLYDVPNSLALFLVPIVIIALYRGVQLKNKIYFTCTAIMIIGIIATQSIGAILAIIGTLLIAYISKTPPSPIGERVRVRAGQAGIWLIICLIITSGIILLFSGRVQYLISPLLHPHATNSATVRLQLWDIGIRLIMQHPLFGVGLGQFEPAYQAELHQEFAIYNQLPQSIQQTKRPPQPEFVFRDPHNWIISFWLNLGILGLLSFIYVNYMAIRTSIKSKISEQRIIALALIAMLLYGLVDTIYWKNDLSVLWWMLILLTL